MNILLKPFKTKNVIILFFIAVIYLSGCSKQSDKIKLGFLYTTEKTERYKKESQYFKQKAEELGAKVYVDQADNNDAIQLRKAIEMFDKDIDVLCLIAVNANTAAAIVRAAKDKNVKVIAYNRMIKSPDIDLFISGNNKKLGEDMCNAVLNKKPEGNYIILNGDKFDRNAVELQQSIDSTLKPYITNGSINILYETFIEDWSDKNGAYELDQAIALTGVKPDVIIAAYDGIADGSIKVLKKYGFAGQVLITGQDAELRAIKHILKGEQLMTIYHPMKRLASRAAIIAYNMALGKMPDKSEISYTDNGLARIPTIKNNSIPITKDNIDEVLIKHGVYTREQIYE
ncbi:MAG: substrate-binding domain-containing protein [Chlorobi bacterium]|nr:substrate-binding domain-containing protein [Chlorobiota bacterium]